jgi:Tfp pilus assembly protein FimV
MAAVIDLHTGRHLPEAAPATPPHLRLVRGGQDPRARSLRRTYLVRRTAVAAVAVAVILVLAQVVGAVSGSVAGAFDSAPAASGQVHVVEPGDTLWSIAGQVAPGIDRRVAVDDLLALNGEGPLRIGQQLQLPASFG